LQSLSRGRRRKLRATALTFKVWEITEIEGIFLLRNYCGFEGIPEVEKVSAVALVLYLPRPPPYNQYT
jgi:hypothetical protein